MNLPSSSVIHSILGRGEIIGIYVLAALLFVVEFCLVYWLHRLPLPDSFEAGSTFITVPPWYQRPRFEVTLLLTVVAGLLFSTCRALWALRGRAADTDARNKAKDLAKDRVSTTLSVAALAGCELLLVTWLRS